MDFSSGRFSVLRLAWPTGLSKPSVQLDGMSSLDRLRGGLAKAPGGGKQEVLRT